MKNDGTVGRLSRLSCHIQYFLLSLAKFKIRNQSSSKAKGSGIVIFQYPPRQDLLTFMEKFLGGRRSVPVPLDSRAKRDLAKELKGLKVRLL